MAHRSSSSTTSPSAARRTVRPPHRAHNPLRYPRRTPPHPRQRFWLLLFVLVLVPLVGQLYPKLVPFPDRIPSLCGKLAVRMAIVDNKAKDKLRKLKVLEGIFISENAQLLWKGNPHFCEQFEDYLTGNMVFFPHFRPIVPMLEKLQQMKGWGPDDYTTLFNELFYVRFGSALDV
jgi:hypothetical protein